MASPPQDALPWANSQVEAVPQNSFSTRRTTLRPERTNECRRVSGTLLLKEPLSYLECGPRLAGIPGPRLKLEKDRRTHLGSGVWWTQVQIPGSPPSCVILVTYHHWGSISSEAKEKVVPPSPGTEDRRKRSRQRGWGRGAMSTRYYPKMIHVTSTPSPSEVQPNTAVIWGALGKSFSLPRLSFPFYQGRRWHSTAPWSPILSASITAKGRLAFSLTLTPAPSHALSPFKLTAQPLPVLPVGFWDAGSSSPPLFVESSLHARAVLTRVQALSRSNPHNHCGGFIIITPVLQMRKSRLRLSNSAKIGNWSCPSSCWQSLQAAPPGQALTVSSWSSLFLRPGAVLPHLINDFALITWCVTPARGHMHALTRTHHLWTNRQLTVGFAGPAAGGWGWDWGRAGLTHLFQITARGQTATQPPQEAARSRCIWVQA